MYISYDSLEYKEFAQQVAEAIASIVHCDITVIDNLFVRIVGTGQFHKRIGEKLDKDNSFYTVMNENKKCIISGKKINIPGNEYVFIQKPTLGEEVSVLMPLVVDGEVLAAIGLSALTEDKMLEIINNYGTYFDFMEKMSELLSSKLKSMVFSKEMELLKINLNIIIDTLIDNVICTNMDRDILFINYSAEKLLGLSRSSVLGKSINEFIKLDDKGNIGIGNSEVENIYSNIIVNKNSIPVLTSIKNIRSGNEVFGKIYFLQEVRNIKEKHSVISGNENKFSIDNIAGSSKAIEKTKSLIKTVSKSSSTVLITGESGTGKELCARAVHSESLRRSGPFIPINCSAIPENLLESELFGYEEGAFTGASKGGKRGKFEQANHGTIFLDEIGDMPMGLQSKILRVLQEKSITPIGSNKIIPLDVRIVTATNKDLPELIEENLFREDLYYRINVIPIHMPSLRERIEDIPIISNDFLRKHSINMGKDIIGFEYSTMETMMKYNWPGNVRELQNAVEYACNIETSHLITFDSLPERIKNYKSEIKTEYKKEECSSQDIIEREMIKGMLELYGTSLKSKEIIADKLNIGIATLYRKIKKYSL